MPAGWDADPTNDPGEVFVPRAQQCTGYYASPSVRHWTDDALGHGPQQTQQHLQEQLQQHLQQHQQQQNLQQQNLHQQNLQQQNVQQHLQQRSPYHNQSA